MHQQTFVRDSMTTSSSGSRCVVLLCWPTRSGRHVKVGRSLNARFTFMVEPSRRSPSIKLLKWSGKFCSPASFCSAKGSAFTSTVGARICVPSVRVTPSAAPLPSSNMDSTTLFPRQCKLIQQSVLNFQYQSSQSADDRESRTALQWKGEVTCQSQLQRLPLWLHMPAAESLCPCRQRPPSKFHPLLPGGTCCASTSR